MHPENLPCFESSTGQHVFCDGQKPPPALFGQRSKAKQVPDFDRMKTMVNGFQILLIVSSNNKCEDEAQHPGTPSENVHRPCKRHVNRFARFCRVSQRPAKEVAIFVLQYCGPAEHSTQPFDPLEGGRGTGDAHRSSNYALLGTNHSWTHYFRIWSACKTL